MLIGTPFLLKTNKKNIALALVDINYDQLKTKLTIEINGQLREATVVETPFYDPKKLLVKNKI